MRRNLYLTRDGRLVTRHGNTFGEVDSDDVGDDDDFGDDDFGDDDLGEADADDLGDDDDDVGDDEDDFGLSPKQRKARRLRRRSPRLSPRAGRLAPVARKRPGIAWAKVPIVVADAATASGARTLSATPQFNFKATDIVATSSSGLASTTGSLTSVTFGDREVWRNSTGVPLALLDPTSFLRNFIKGNRIRGGFTVAIGVTSTGTEILTITLIGFKQTTGRC